MTPEQWLGMAAGIALAVAVAALASYGMSGGRLWRAQSRRFVCPVSRKEVLCTLVRDVRTGQFQNVESCTAFADPTDVRCAEECGDLLNLGFPLAGQQGKA
jgi:hypothetical protein